MIVQGWLSQCLQRMSAEAQLIASKSALLENVLQSTTQRDFSKQLDRFELSCRRCLQ